jgi:hypothetical protein
MAVRSMGMTAPGSRTGPPWYAGNSCTYRSPRREAGTIAAWTSAGSRISGSSIENVTSTPSATFRTSMISPTSTPRTRTFPPGKSWTARLNMAL